MKIDFHNTAVRFYRKTTPFAGSERLHKKDPAITGVPR
uniref:Uncharacterized protein n=1 Tax=Siphoviridae sp. ctE6L85 TaxID=2826202 RepID=A0A8S5QRH8_9CAUD|nr:MAG TPA: hypothetical protein [Siphoviridae sp. ctE6L85]